MKQKQKKTLNDNRIQKKVREANSEEIQEIRNKLNETNQKVTDLENKIQREITKICFRNTRTRKK